MTVTAAAPAEFPMRRWVFEEAAGRYDIDLGDSNVACGSVDQLSVPQGLLLDYGLDRGTPRLRAQVAELYGQPGAVDRVLITHGAQEALYLAYATLLRPGDQVIAFRPGWPQSWSAPAALGAHVEVVGLRPDHTLDVEAAERAAGPRLRLIVAGNPANPTGQQVSPADLRALERLAGRYGGVLLLDEEYAPDLGQSAAVGGPRTVSVSSVSKVYGFPGLRTGWLYGPPDLVAAAAEYKHLTTISNSCLTEALASQVLSERAAYLDRYRRLTGEGLAIVRTWLDRHDGLLELIPPQGTPFAWLRLTSGEPALELCRRALDAGVLLMPGETLGAPGHLRLCFARDPHQLADGLGRLDTLIEPTNRRGAGV